MRAVVLEAPGGVDALQLQDLPIPVPENGWVLIRVMSTTRSLAKADRLREIGVDHVILDDGDVAAKVREILPEGADIALELVGAPTLRDTVRALRVHGVACFSGMLSNEWIIPDFYPIDFLPNGVRLTAYAGDAGDLPADVLSDFLDAASADPSIVPLDRNFDLTEMAAAHAYIEENRTTGKIVVLTWRG